MAELGSVGSMKVSGPEDVGTTTNVRAAEDLVRQDEEKAAGKGQQGDLQRKANEAMATDPAVIAAKQAQGG